MALGAKDSNVGIVCASIVANLVALNKQLDFNSFVACWITDDAPTPTPDANIRYQYPVLTPDDRILMQFLGVILSL